MEVYMNQEAEETVIIIFLLFAFDDVEDNQRETMNIIDCNHIRIDAFSAENEESLALYSDTGIPKSVIGKEQMKRIVENLRCRCMPAIRSSRVFPFIDVSANSFRHD